MKRYTVIGVYSDCTEIVQYGDATYEQAQRYASYFHADDPDHAIEQAIDEAGTTLVIAAVIEGEANVVT